MRKAKKEINYSRLILKYVGLTVAWTVGIYWFIYLVWNAWAWFFNNIDKINWWYAVFFVVFVICCLGNLSDMLDEIHYLKDNREEEWQH